MSPVPTSNREVAIPMSVLATLRAELEKETEGLAAVHALHRTGYAAGMASVKMLHKESGGDVYRLNEDGFWVGLQKYFDKRGWGTLEFSAAHNAIAVLSSPDWAEATPEDPNPEASCSFSTGFLSGLLSQVAGGPIAVLETTCRSRGQDACTFAFGSEKAIHELYGHMLEGTDLEGALAAL